MPTEVERPGDSAMLLKELHTTNLAEIQQGKLAEERAKDAKVRKFAAMLVSDHTTADKLVQDCAARLGVALSDDLPVDVQRQVDDLRATQGDFDRVFVSSEAKGHDNLIADVEMAMRTADPDTQKLCKKLLPELKAHAAEAKKLDHRLATVRA